MPDSSGKKRSFKSARLSPESQHKGLIQRQQVLSRQKALQRICRVLTHQDCPITADILNLITLFNIKSDELTEAGLSFEVVRALETRCPFLCLYD